MNKQKMTQKLNVTSAVELTASVSVFQNLLAEVGQKNKQENGTKWLRMFLATRKLAFLLTRVSRKTWSSAEPLVKTFGKKIS